MQDETYPQTERSTTPTKGRTSNTLRREIDDDLDFYYTTTGKGHGFRNPYLLGQDGSGRDKRRMEGD